VAGLLAVGLRREVARDGELGIESAPLGTSLAAGAKKTSSVSVSDHASPADLTGFNF